MQVRPVRNIPVCIKFGTSLPDLAFDSSPVISSSSSTASLPSSESALRSSKHFPVNSSLNLLLGKPFERTRKLECNNNRSFTLMLSNLQTTMLIFYTTFSTPCHMCKRNSSTCTANSPLSNVLHYNNLALPELPVKSFPVTASSLSSLKSPEPGDRSSEPLSVNSPRDSPLLKGTERTQNLKMNR